MEKKQFIVWLDDVRSPETYFDKDIFDEYNVIWCKDSGDFAFYVDHIDDIYAVCFDHDLGDGKPSGYDCAKYLVEVYGRESRHLPKYMSQSGNPVGRANIISYLDSYEKSLSL